MLDNKVVNELLVKSGVDNDLGHHENGELHTAITSREELLKLIYLAFEAGWTQANLKYSKW